MNICIISTPRSGSTYFAALLKQSPTVIQYVHEPFNPEYLSHNYTKECEEQLNIIKSISNQNNVLIKDNESIRISSLYPNDIKLKNIIKEYEILLKNNFYLIKLVRNNLFEQTLSVCIAVSNNIWIRHPSTIYSDKISIDIEYFKNTYFEFERKQKLLDEYSNCNEIVYYEDITGDSKLDWNLIKGIVPPADYIPIESIRNIDKQIIVENYEEILKIYEREILNVY